MPQPLFKLIFEGKLKEGETLDTVKPRLAALFRTNAAAIDQLFSGKPIVIKHNLSQQEVVKYTRALEHAGVCCRVEKEEKTSEAPRTPASTPVRKKPPIQGQPSSIQSKTTSIHAVTITRQQASFYHSLLWPLVKIKKAFETVFDLILGMIWRELMGSKQTYTQTATLIAFVIFSATAVIVYRLPDFVEEVVLWMGVAFWLFDRFVARHAYFQTIATEKIALKAGKDNQLIWKKTDTEGETYHTSFEQHHLTQISIARESFSGGAFQEELGTVWRIYLALDDGSDFLIDETSEVMRAIGVANQLSGYLGIPTKFAHSEGAHPFASEPLQTSSALIALKQHFSGVGSVKSQEEKDRIHIFSTWNRRSVFLLLRDVLSSSGFLLFLLIMEGVMYRYGLLLNWLIGPYFGMYDTVLYLDFSFSGILSLFKPMGGWFDTLEIIGATSAMLYQGWKMSRRKQITIDPQKTIFLTGRRQLAELNTAEVRSPLLITAPKPTILVMDRHKVAELDDLQTEHEFRALTLNLEAGLKKFQAP